MNKFGPAGIYRWWLKRWHAATVRPPVGTVDFGDLRILAPVSEEFGYDRGTPIDRHYIERFLDANRDVIRGHVLEIGDDEYTRRFGGSRVARSDVLHVSEGNPKATLVGDLTSAGHVASDCFDCIIFTQTLQFIFDHRVALATLHRILKRGAHCLLPFPALPRFHRISGVSCAPGHTRSTLRSAFLQRHSRIHRCSLSRRETYLWRRASCMVLQPGALR